MAAQDHLHPELFATLKSRANATGKAQRAPGTDIYVSASKASKNRRKQDVRDYHSSLVPMKNTLNESNYTFARLSHHLKVNNQKIGAPNTKKAAIRWAVEIHNRDPKNFIKNIGL